MRFILKVQHNINASFRIKYIKDTNTRVMFYALRFALCFINTQDQWTALITAAKEGHTEVVSTLLEYDAAVDRRDLVGSGCC